MNGKIKNKKIKVINPPSLPQVRPVSGISTDTAKALIEDPLATRCLSSQELRELPTEAKCLPSVDGSDPFELHPKDKVSKNNVLM